MDSRHLRIIHEVTVCEHDVGLGLSPYIKFAKSLN